MKFIQVGGHNKVRGEYRIRGWAIVDDEDFDFLNQWKWQMHGSGHVKRIDENEKTIFMHRLLLKTPDGFITDHINRNPLDNRKTNLRVADKRINSINRPEQSNNSSGKKGVSWNKDAHRWESYIWNRGKKILLGYFKDFNKAVEIRIKAENIYHAI